MTDWARVAALEASGRAALPALIEHRHGDWLLRVSGGDTKRVNSANPLVGGARAAEALATAERLYVAHGLPSRFRLTPLASPEASVELAACGYEVADPSWTMVAALAPLPPDASVRMTARVDPAWLTRTEQLSGRSPGAAAVQAQLLAAMPGPLGLAMIKADNEVVAAGYVSIGAGRAQLSDIVVAPQARGRGLGRRLVTALLAWAHAQNCREAMLQVLDANRVARDLYRSFGFVDAYPYHYRVRR